MTVHALFAAGLARLHRFVADAPVEQLARDGAHGFFVI